MMTRSFVTVAAASAAFAALPSAAHAVTTGYAGGTYTQNFDGLPAATQGAPGATNNTVVLTGRGPHALNGVAGTTGMEGWTASNFGGSSSNTEFRAQDGSLAGSGGRGVISFGTEGSSDRALGVLATSNQVSRFGLTLRNDTAATFVSMDLSFVGEQWRVGNVAAPGNTLFFGYAVGTGDINAGGFTAVPALDFVSPAVGDVTVFDGSEFPSDGNAAAFREAIGGTVFDLNWGPGQLLTLRWTGEDLTGQDNGLAIDDLVFSAVVPEPASLGVLSLGALALVRRRRA